jgi:hypothetical protein
MVAGCRKLAEKPILQTALQKPKEIDKNFNGFFVSFLLAGR